MAENKRDTYSQTDCNIHLHTKRTILSLSCLKFTKPKDYEN